MTSSCKRWRRGPSGAFAAWGTSVLACALLFFSRPAAAHAIGLSRGDYRVTADGVDVALVLARAEAMAMVPSLDADGRGSIDEGSLRLARSALARNTIDKIRVTTPGGPCASTAVDASLTEEDGLEVRGSYLCPPPTNQPLTVTLSLLDDLSHGHRHVAHAVAGAVTSEHLLFRANASFIIERAAKASADAPSTVAHWAGFVRMGMEHILTGYDHLLFLFALVLAGGSVRSLALAVTSFTVGHSVTLALAVLGFMAAPTRWIEPAIALSVAYVGLENFFARPAARAWIAFPFGLVHGFGFAGALGEAAIPQREVPWALFSFNAGVEIGQVAWMLVLGILVTRLRRWPRFRSRAVPALSAIIVVIGLVWFVGRVRETGMGGRGATYASDRCG
jgi:hydrogenase/urease accessory protein HupE